MKHNWIMVVINKIKSSSKMHCLSLIFTDVLGSDFLGEEISIKSYLIF